MSKSSEFSGRHSSKPCQARSISECTDDAGVMKYIDISPTAPSSANYAECNTQQTHHGPDYAVIAPLCSSSDLQTSVSERDHIYPSSKTCYEDSCLTTFTNTQSTVSRNKSPTSNTLSSIHELEPVFNMSNFSDSGFEDKTLKSESSGHLENASSKNEETKSVSQTTPYNEFPVAESSHMSNSFHDCDPKREPIEKSEEDTSATRSTSMMSGYDSVCYHSSTQGMNADRDPHALATDNLTNARSVLLKGKDAPSVVERFVGNTGSNTKEQDLIKDVKYEKIIYDEHNEECDLSTRNQTRMPKKPLSCYHCHKGFSIKSHLAQHLRTHTGEKPFSCPNCDKRFSLKNNLVRHLRTHTGKKPFSCPYCDKRFTDKSNLPTHIQQHTGEKPFACSYCDKRFSFKSPLVEHVRTHTGEKPFSCPNCEKRFSLKHNLVTHIRQHTGEKPFSCPYCDQRFSDKSHLSKHIQKHTGEKQSACPYCDKRINTKSHLVEHMRTHTGEKPFSCPKCDKRFSFKNNLVRHIRTHAGEKQ